MLELSGENSFRVHVRQFLRKKKTSANHAFIKQRPIRLAHLDLQRRLEAGRVLISSSHDQQRPLLAQRRLRQRLELLVVQQDLLDLTRQLVQSVDDGVPPDRERDAVLRQLNRPHDESNVLRRVGLGRRDTDFRSGVDVDTAVRFTRDGRTDDVDDSDVERAALEAVAHGEDRVGRFARLRDKDADIVAEDGRLAIEEVGSELNRDRDLGQLLEDRAGLPGRETSAFALGAPARRRLTAKHEW
jgi:hypothetical protein